MNICKNNRKGDTTYFLFLTYIKESILKVMWCCGSLPLYKHYLITYNNIYTNTNIYTYTKQTIFDPQHHREQSEGGVTAYVILYSKTFKILLYSEINLFSQATFCKNR